MEPLGAHLVQQGGKRVCERVVYTERYMVFLFNHVKFVLLLRMKNETLCRGYGNASEEANNI